MFYTKVLEKMKTHILCSVTPLPENCAVCEIMCEKYCRAGQATDGNVECAHFMLEPKASGTHSEYVVLIAFPLQQWLHKCT
jgi:hypothetical protein